LTTLRRLINNCLLPTYHGSSPPEWSKHAIDDGLAGIKLYGPTLSSLDGDIRTVISDPLREIAPDVLLALDEEAGDVTRLDYLWGSRYPGNYALGVLDDVSVTRAVARSTAADLIRAGINLNLAPCADVLSDPDNTAIGVRSFGEDPRLVASHVAAYVEALQGSNVAATAKHFPGHGNVSSDPHYNLPTVDCDLQTLHRRELAPFAAAIEVGVRCIMAGHVRFPPLDDAPTTFSRRISTDLLRTELGFDGVLMTDALEMNEIRGRWGLARSAVLAWKAGADLVIIGSIDGRDACAEIYRATEDAIADGFLSLTRLEEAAARVADLRAWAAAPAPPIDVDESIGMTAARRLLASTVKPLPSPPFVVEFRQVMNDVVGEVPWGIADSLARLGWLAGSAAVYEHDDVAAIEPPAGAPLVVVVRDGADHPWQMHGLRTLTAKRDVAALIEMGMPSERTSTGTPVVHTYGAGLVNSRAVAEALSGRINSRWST
jgi:beta-glucosidase-like glycosyl hydrolase